MSATTHKDELSDNITLFEQQIKRLQSAIDYELETKTKSDILADQVHETTSLPASPAIATVEEPLEEEDSSVIDFFGMNPELISEHANRLKEYEERAKAAALLQKMIDLKNERERKKAEETAALLQTMKDLKKEREEREHQEAAAAEYERLLLAAEEQEEKELLAAEEQKEKEKKDEEDFKNVYINYILFEISSYKEQIEEINTQLQTETKELEVINQKLASKTERLKVIDQQLPAKTKELEVINQQLAAKTTELEKDTANLKQIQNQYVFNGNENYFQIRKRLTAKKTTTEMEIGQINSERERVQHDIAALRDERENVPQDIVALGGEKDQLQKTIEELGGEIKKKQEAIVDLQRKPSSGGKKTRKRKPVHDTRKRIKKIRCDHFTSKVNGSTSRRCRP